MYTKRAVLEMAGGIFSGGCSRCHHGKRLTLHKHCGKFIMYREEGEADKKKEEKKDVAVKGT